MIYWAWGTLHSIGVLQSKCLDSCWKMVSDVTFQGLGITFCSLLSWAIYGKCYIILKLIADPMPSFVQQDQVEEMLLPSHAHYLSLAELCTLVSGTFKEAGVVQIDDDRCFWSPIINKGSEVEHKLKWDVSLARYSSANHLIVEYLVDQEESL